MSFASALAAQLAPTRKWPTPGAMAQALDPGTAQTAMLDLVDAELVALADGKVPRLMVFTAPQEGKSQRVSRRYPAWLLSQDPTLRIAIVSYDQEHATRWGRDVKRDIATHPELGISLREDSRAAGRWETPQGGGIYCAGIAGALTGRAVDVLIIDDPVKDRQAAESSTMRQAAWDWWESVAVTRLSPRGRVVLMMCMTGDTPVLMADGTERPLRDVRAGDSVATYEGGRLITSTVRNWANQGPDSILSVRMKSGAVVRANSRHPFLTIEDSGEAWRTTAQLKPGSRILRATGESGGASPARSRAATPQRSARACAPPTTTGIAGSPESGLRPSLPRTAGQPGSSIAMASPVASTTAWSTLKAVYAPSASRFRPRATPARTGPGSSASTMTTTPAGYAACCATTATSQSATASPLRSSAQPLTTYKIVPDEVVEVVRCGVEDVFDVQIDRTENFIANGLVSHNTRWHKSDLAGRILEAEPQLWRVVSIPAVAEGAHDPLGRRPGEELVSARRRAPGYFTGLAARLSAYVWRSLYQQRPTDPTGSIFLRDRWRYWTWLDWPDYLDLGGVTLDLRDTWRFITADLAASTRTSADWTVAAAWALTLNRDLVCLGRVRARTAQENHWDLIRPLASEWRTADVGVESTMMGTTLVRSAVRGGLSPFDLHADRDKVTRAIPYSHMQRQGQVWLPQSADWLDEWVGEHADFPTGVHDDQVDVGAYAARQAIGGWHPGGSPATPPEYRPDPFEAQLTSAFGAQESGLGYI